MNLELKMSAQEQTTIIEQPKKRVYKKKTVTEETVTAEGCNITETKPKRQTKPKTKAKTVEEPMDTTKQLEEIIMSEMKMETEIKKMVDENMKNPDNEVLAHLGQYVDRKSVV